MLFLTIVFLFNVSAFSETTRTEVTPEDQAPPKSCFPELKEQIDFSKHKMSFGEDVKAMFEANLIRYERYFKSVEEKIESSESDTCERWQAYNDGAVALKNMSPTIESHVQNIRSYWEGFSPLWHVPRFAERYSCGLACEGKKNLSMSACFAGCLLHHHEIVRIQDSTFQMPVERFRSCPVFSKQEIEEIKELVKKAEASLDGAKIHEMRNWAYKSIISPKDKFIKDWGARLQNLKPKDNFLKSGQRACQKKRNAYLRELKKNVIRGTRPEGTGSLFYTIAKPKRMNVVTALHVVALDESGASEELVPIKSGDKEFVFDATSKNIHFGNDLVWKEMPRVGAPLSVVQSESVPQVGQEIEIAGYPGIEDGDFSVQSCRFDGFVRGSTGYFKYLVFCPGMNISNAGMSGGPSRKEGQVFGVVSEGPLIASMIYLTPLSQKDDGSLQMGLSQSFSSDACYGGVFSLGTSHRCQVGPVYKGRREKKGW